MNRTSAIAVLTLLALTLAGVLLLGGGAGSRPAAGLVPVGDRPAEAPFADERAELVLAPEGDLVSAPPEGAREPVRSEAAERPKGRVRARPASPTPAPPETREAPPRSEEAVFRLRVIVTFESFELSAPNESVVVTAFLGDSDGVSTSRAHIKASAASTTDLHRTTTSRQLQSRWYPICRAASAVGALLSRARCIFQTFRTPPIPLQPPSRS